MISWSIKAFVPGHGMTSQRRMAHLVLAGKKRQEKAVGSVNVRRVRSAS